MPKHLLYLHNAVIGSTTANVVQVMAMCNAWIQAGYRVTLVLRASKQTSDETLSHFKARYAAPSSLEIHLLKTWLPHRIHRHLSALKVGWLARRFRPDLCFVRDPAYFHALRLTGVPVIFELHNTRLHLGSNLIDRLYHKMVIRGSQREACLKIIAISEALAIYWRNQGIPPENILVLHDGFNAHQFQSKPSRAEVRISYGLPKDRQLVVYTGNLQENRGIGYLIALAQLNPALLFFAAGGTPDRVAYYRELCLQQKIDNLIFHGQLPHVEIPDLLMVADVLLAVWSDQVPTINVCSPLKVFEYMAAGVPAVYPGYPTIHEVVMDGINGFLAVPDHIESLNATLHRALNLTDEMKDEYERSSREIAFSQYAWDIRISRIINELPPTLESA